MVQWTMLHKRFSEILGLKIGQEDVFVFLDAATGWLDSIRWLLKDLLDGLLASLKNYCSNSLETLWEHDRLDDEGCCSGSTGVTCSVLAWQMWTQVGFQ